MLAACTIFHTHQLCPKIRRIMEGNRMSELEKKRERDNKISKLMGEYLLKGFKMLGSTCNVCGTILLKDRQQQDYCIGCSEVDIHVTYSEFQALQKPQVNQHESSANKDPELENSCEEPGPSSTSDASPFEERCSATIDNAVLKLQERLALTVHQLGAANSVEMDIKLCELITSCGNALRTLKDLQH